MPVGLISSRKSSIHQPYVQSIFEKSYISLVNSEREPPRSGAGESPLLIYSNLYPDGGGGVVNGHFGVCSQNWVGAKRYLFDQLAKPLTFKRHKVLTFNREEFF